MRINPTALKDNLARFQTGAYDELMLVGDGSALSGWQLSDDRRTSKGFIIQGDTSTAPFALKVKSRHLKEIISLWPDEPLYIAGDGNRIKMEAYHSLLEYRLVTNEPAEHDATFSPVSVPWESVDAKVFTRFLDILIAHGNEKDPRDICKHVRFSDGFAIATDGHRLAKITAPFGALNSYMPVSSAREFRKMTDTRRSAGPVQVAFHGEQVWFAQADRIATAKLLDDSAHAGLDAMADQLFASIEKSRFEPGVSLAVDSAQLHDFLKKDKSTLRFHFNNESTVTTIDVESYTRERSIPWEIRRDGNMKSMVKPLYLRDVARFSEGLLSIKFFSQSNMVIIEDENDSFFVVMTIPDGSQWEPIESLHEEAETVESLPDVMAPEHVEPEADCPPPAETVADPLPAHAAEPLPDPVTTATMVSPDPIPAAMTLQSIDQPAAMPLDINRPAVYRRPVPAQGCPVCPERPLYHAMASHGLRDARRSKSAPCPVREGAG